jgi:GTP-binding protein
MSKMTNEIRDRFKYLSYCPIIFISAKEKNRLNKIFDTIEKMREEVKIKVTTSLLNNVLSKAQINNPAPKFKGRRLDISYATQVEGQIPTFVIFSNDPKYLHFTYARYIENQIRESFGIKNVPILVYYKDKNSRIRT